MYINNILFHAQLCTNDYFNPNSFSAKGDFFLLPYYLARTTDAVEHPWYISSSGDSLGVLSYNISFFDLRNALQRVNSVMQLARFHYYYKYGYFKFIYH